jgi:hypothetical protein
MWNKEKFNFNLSQLMGKDFKFIPKQGKWEKRIDDRILNIYVGYNEYYFSSFYIKGISAEIYFPEIENILESFSLKHFPDKDYGNGTIHKSFVKLPNIDYSKFELEIKDQDSFDEVANEIKKIFEKGIVPFFEKYSTLKTVFEETEIMPIEELRNFIVQPLPKRRMVIKKVCNDENYQDYVDRIINYYKSENDEVWKETEQLDAFLKNMV